MWYIICIIIAVGIGFIINDFNIKNVINENIEESVNKINKLIERINKLEDRISKLEKKYMDDLK